MDQLSSQNNLISFVSYAQTLNTNDKFLLLIIISKSTDFVQI